MKVDKANFSNMRDSYSRNSSYYESPSYSPKKQSKKDNQSNSEFQRILSELLKDDKS